MKQKIQIIAIALTVILIGCNNQSNNPNRTFPTHQFKSIDNLLSEISEKPEEFTIPSNKTSRIKGKNGTVIHVKPNRLVMSDGSSFVDSIKVELIEMIDYSSLILNNAQTVSNGEILTTGGSYYINMTSAGKQLKIKAGDKLEIDFPKITESKMELFYGEKSDSGNLNSVRTKERLRNKRIIKPQQIKQENITKIKKPKTNNEEINDYEIASKNYDVMELSNFGWININRFLTKPGEKVNIDFKNDDDSFTAIRIYAAFKNINSVLTTQYWNGKKEGDYFQNIPVGEKITILALAVKNQTPYIFEKTITTSKNQSVKLEFKKTTRSDIKHRIYELDK
jgi:hypothetical protein